jgi:23S rRNA pseudouridine2605 synthase
MPEERIQKVLAAAGVASRRAAEELVAAGRVQIDGRLAAIGQKVDPLISTIEVDGLAVGVGAARAYVALHKPAGVTSTTRDRHAATTVLDLVPTAMVPDGTRLYPVGRLDQDSEGLLLLTNDGAWAERILHPRFGVEREYAVGLGAPLRWDQVQALNTGVRLDEGLARLAAPIRAVPAADVRRLGGLLDPRPDPGLAWYRAILAQGWKRQLRRMFGAVGAPIVRLVRVRIGSVRLGGLGAGRARSLKRPEVDALAGSVPRQASASRQASAPGQESASRRASGQQAWVPRPAGEPTSPRTSRSGRGARSAPKCHDSGDASGSIMPRRRRT